MKVVDNIIEEWRVRLFDISWFMRGVNEKIARMANEEEGCKGRFWEGRFKSQALLDEAAILSCMVYVDLNPIRANIEKTLEESDFTAIQQRLHAYAQDNDLGENTDAEAIVDVLEERLEQQQALKEALNVNEQPEAALMPFDGSSHTSIDVALPFTQADYFALVDKTGRIIREGKKGFISSEEPEIIKRFGIDPDQWIDHVKKFGQHYGMCVGAVDRVVAYAALFGQQWSKGVGKSAEVYRQAA
jgi:hypothetical protein